MGTHIHPVVKGSEPSVKLPQRITGYLTIPYEYLTGEIKKIIKRIVELFDIEKIQTKDKTHPQWAGYRSYYRYGDTRRIAERGEVQNLRRDCLLYRSDSF